MTTPIVVTDEMRQAVYDADCAVKGHIYNLTTMMNSANQVKSRDPNLLPHVSCLRCTRVWLVIEDDGDNYDDAETKFQDKLKATDDLSKKITEIRNNRNNPKPPKEIRQ
jgi:hypothetical protein